MELFIKAVDKKYKIIHQHGMTFVANQDGSRASEDTIRMLVEQGKLSAEWHPEAFRITEEDF